MNERTHRRLAAIVSADVVGYSRLMGLDEEGTLAALRSHRTALIDDKIAEHGGRIVKTMGDGLLVEFPSVVDAVRSATAVQEGMLVRNVDTPPEKQIVFRIGINLGDIIIEGEDILGDGVNIAARLEALAEPGGICISGRVHDDVQDRLDHVFLDIGKRDLKNIARAIQCWSWHPGGSREKEAKTTAEFLKAPVLAVLPFNSFSQDPEYEFFADGLSEDLTTLLSAYREFPVIARNSAFTFKGKEFDIMEAGRQLGADYVVEGSVRVAGKRMRVNAQLIDVSSSHHLWAQRFDRDIDDIFTLQDELSLQIAANISPNVVRNENTRLDAATTEDIGHWSAMVRVRNLTTIPDAYQIAAARDILLEQERLRPKDSMVQAYLATCCSIEIVAGMKHFRDVRGEMLERARRAIQLDPSNYLAYNMLSIAEQFHGHLEAALQANERSIELNPSAGLSYVWRATSKLLLGQLEESLADFETMERLSPFDPLLHIKNGNMARALFNLERYEEAVAAAKKSVVDAPDMPFYRLALIGSLALSGRLEEARQAAGDFNVLFPDASVPSLLVNFTTRNPDDLNRFKEGLRKAQLVFD